MSTPNGTLTVGIANLLLGCLCAATREQPNPPEHCCLRSGTEVPADIDLNTDICCEGLAYVLPGDTWPSFIFPDQDITRQANVNCGIVSWAMEFRLGIIRCAPAGTDDIMPSCADWTASATQMLYDAESLRRTVCCFEANYQTSFPDLVGMSVIFNRQQQGQVQGGCIERFTTVQVQISSSCCLPIPSPINVPV